MIGELPKGIDPRTLEDHLLSRGMKSRIDRRPDGVSVVWILDENHVDQAREEMREYLAAPDDPRFRASASKAREARAEEARRVREFRRNQRDAGDLWGGPTFRQRPVTILTVALAVVVYVVQQSGYGRDAVAWLAFFDWRNGLPDNRPWLGLTDVMNGQVWRLVTPALLHFSGLHVLFNCWWTIALGTAIERHRGSARLLAMLIATAIFSNMIEYEYMERLHAAPLRMTRFYTFGGLSGVNYALFGYVWMMGELYPAEGLRIDSRNAVILLGWMVLCFTGALGPIANAAHLGGLAAGMFLAWRRF